MRWSICRKVELESVLAFWCMPISALLSKLGSPLATFVSYLNLRHMNLCHLMIPPPSLLVHSNRKRLWTCFVFRSGRTTLNVIQSYSRGDFVYEAFCTPVSLTADLERFFWVMYACEGPETVACTNFFHLRTSERVLNQILKDLSVLIHWFHITRRPEYDNQAPMKEEDRIGRLECIEPFSVYVHDSAVRPLFLDLHQQCKFYLTWCTRSLCVLLTCTIFSMDMGRKNEHYECQKCCLRIQITM